MFRQLTVVQRHSLLKADASSRMMTVRSTHFWRFVACFAGALLLLLGAAYTLRRRPILFHVFADTGCACGEYHDEVTGLIVRNPFRDPYPNRVLPSFSKNFERAAALPMPRSVSTHWMGTAFPTGGLSIGTTMVRLSRCSTNSQNTQRRTPSTNCPVRG